MSTVTAEKPAAEATPAKAAKPAKTAAPKKAAPEETGPSGKQLAAEFEKGAKASLGSLKKTQKQNYFSLKNEKTGVTLYVTPSKAHARVSLSFPISDSADVATAVEFVERAAALQTKADAK